MKNGWFLLSITIILSLAISAQTAASPPVNPGTIRIGAYQNPPKVFTDQTDEFIGIFPDLLRHIASEEGWQFEFVPGSWTECLQRLEKGALDIMVDVAFSEERAEKYAFTAETVFLNWGTIYTCAGFYANSFLDLEGRTVAVMRGSIHTDGSQGIKAILKQFDIACKLIEVENYQTVFNLIAQGRADAGIVNRLFGELNEKSYRFNRSPIVFNPRHLKFAFPRNARLTPYLKQRIDIRLKALKDASESVYFQIIDHYFSGMPGGFYANRPPYQKIDLAFTPQEAEWIARHPQIRMGVDPEFSPFESISAKGEYQGMAADYVNIISRGLGIRFEPVKGLAWKEVIDRASKGEIDLLPCVGISAERKRYLIFSKPYLSFPRVIITQTDAAVATPADLAGKKVAVQVDSSHHAYIKENTDFTPVLYDRFQEAMLALSRREVDAVIGNLAVATDTMTKLNLTNLKIAAHTTKSTAALAFAVRKDWPVLITLINKILDAISEDVKMKISQKWLPGYISLPGKPKISKMEPLTAREKTFLQSHPRLRMGIDSNYPPFEWIDPTGKHQGISSDYISVLEERLGISFSLVPDLTWSQILEGARRGDIDVIPCISETPDRRSFLRFTTPYLTFPIVIVTRIRTPFISRLEDLYGKRVSVVKGYAPREAIDRRHPAIRPSLVNTPLEGLRQVSTGASEAYIGNLAVCTYLMQKQHITNLKVAAPAEEIASTEMAIGVRADWPELVSILDKALASVGPGERNAIGAKWMSVRFEHAVNWGRVIRIVGSLMVVGILIVGGFLHWNRKLSREIAVRKEMEIQLKEAKKEAERANKAKSIFLANMSHEIRTPMNAILGYSQLMQKETSLSAENQKNIEIINRSGEHLLNLINDILEMSKIEAGRIVLQPSDFDLWALLEDLEMMFTVQADAKKLKFDVNRSKSVPRYILMDEAKLRQILINLLGNAIKFTDRGDVSLKINTRLTIEENGREPEAAMELIFEVSDTGLGMTPDDLKKIFHSFEQTDSGRGREGTGLGLSICKAYIKFMGGEIQVASEPGKGSTFRVTFTVTQSKADDVRQPKISPPVTGLASGQPPYRILVVDDKSTNRNLLMQILKRVGFTVKEAADGEQAVALCRSWRPHLVMMDIRMPVVDGVEATRRIKADSETKDVIIIAVSASALEEQRISVLQHGADAFIRKPYKEDVILEEIKTHLKVSYVYAEETGPDNTPVAAPSAEMLTALPAQSIEKMHAATEGGYHEELLKAIAEIEKIDFPTAAALRRLAEEYDYDRLLELFQTKLKRDADESNIEDKNI